MGYWGLSLLSMSLLSLSRSFRSFFRLLSIVLNNGGGRVVLAVRTLVNRVWGSAFPADMVHVSFLVVRAQADGEVT